MFSGDHHQVFKLIRLSRLGEAQHETIKHVFWSIETLATIIKVTPRNNISHMPRPQVNLEPQVGLGPQVRNQPLHLVSLLGSQQHQRTIVERMPRMLLSVNKLLNNIERAAVPIEKQAACTEISLLRRFVVLSCRALLTCALSCEVGPCCCANS